jgi:hypothetical protein
MVSEINQMLHASVPILVVAFGLIAVPAMAFARTVYDGAPAFAGTGATGDEPRDQTSNRNSHPVAGLLVGVAIG